MPYQNFTNLILQGEKQCVFLADYYGVSLDELIGRDVTKFK